ncbi:RHS repeat-associated core domain-containing protein [Actinomadura montaniterrae]|uniref:RHS repeat-associated core domain-containing protein n=1 Tax=Actinomadura montaniterrae TaxID=1803903 RepID=A0A6L3VMC8_9ACTN|nr:RHS repeat-associated core domain-containing protein [Actinomadura montaniterrae]
MSHTAVIRDPRPGRWAGAASTPRCPPGDGVPCPLRFPGQYYDDESGFHYNYHRYYDPETARYISADPIGLAGGPNPHAYVPNPWRWADPLRARPRLQRAEPGGEAGDEQAGERRRRSARQDQPPDRPQPLQGRETRVPGRGGGAQTGHERSVQPHPRPPAGPQRAAEQHHPRTGP